MDLVEAIAGISELESEIWTSVGDLLKRIIQV